MRVLVLGSGAREHALAWRLARDEGVEVWCAPGNAGVEAVAKVVPVDLSDVAAVVSLARAEGIDLVVVGPEAPLVAGVVDALEDAGIAAFGPNRAAARLEGSKVFAKELMARHGVPTAGFRVFDDPDAACAYIRAASRPLVVKADGLAAGKGVVVADGPEDAVAAVDHIMRERAFGDAGARVLIEERLVGPEVSYHVVSDGERYVALASAQDHKRAFDGDRGPNTGGMGAYSPAPMVTPEVERAICERVVEPTLRGMAAEGAAFRGALFIGLMIVDGAPFVLEYNVRFGDPECEALMARWDGPVLPLFMGSARGDLREVRPACGAPASVCVVLASAGYPGAYDKGKRVDGLDEAAGVEGVTVFHAGTRREAGATVTSGGRVLAVTAVGEDIDDAAARAYRAVECVRFEGKQLRRDIGWQARRRLG
ncbi:MAG: phosphoribosylamine--glycine ligase [Myxococcales bacterium]|nr:phosphoribosylamine--glycine ligase [Myxococcales bacterium]